MPKLFSGCTEIHDGYKLRAWIKNVEPGPLPHSYQVGPKHFDCNTIRFNIVLLSSFDQSTFPPRTGSTRGIHSDFGKKFNRAFIDGLKNRYLGIISTTNKN